MSKIVVIGSANMDTTHYLGTEFPDELTQESLNEIVKTARVLGGKGANQARATKLQSKDDEVYFIGCVGKDEAGLNILQELKKVGVDFSGTKVLDGTATDGRIINVDIKGENRMMGYGDCIKQLTPDLLDKEILDNADIIAIQLKMPAETSKYVIEYCTKHNKKLIIDPTPIEKSSILLENDRELLKQATFLTPNEEEAFALIGYQKGKTVQEIKEEFKHTSKEDRLRMIDEFIAKNPNVIATLGADGVMYKSDAYVCRKPAYPTVCKDSTGAGDTFNGGFIAALARGKDIHRAVEFGLMAASIKVKHLGAQNGVPTLEETERAIEVTPRYKINKDKDER